MPVETKDYRPSCGDSRHPSYWPYRQGQYQLTLDQGLVDIRERNIVAVCRERHRFFVIVITRIARVVFKPLLKECLNAPFSDVNGMAHDGAMQAQ
jgi:hypothetical protein